MNIRLIINYNYVINLEVSEELAQSDLWPEVERLLEKAYTKAQSLKKALNKAADSLQGFVDVGSPFLSPDYPDFLRKLGS